MENSTRKKKKHPIDRLISFVDRFISSIGRLTNSILNLLKKRSKLLYLIIIFVVAISIIIDKIEPIVNAISKGISYFHKDSSVKFDDAKLKILILPFFYDINDVSSKIKIEDIIEKGLSEEKPDYDLSIDIKIDRNSTPPRDSAEARKIGEEKTADFVIFGDLESGSNDYRINYLITKNVKIRGIPEFIIPNHISEFKKNLKMSKILSHESLKNEKFIIYTILGFSELNDGQCDKAFNLLGKALALLNEMNDPNFKYVKSYFSLCMAACYFGKWEVENALTYLDYALESDQDNFDARIARLFVYFYQREFVKAKADIFFFKEREFEYNNLVLTLSGVINLIENNTEEAFKDFNKAIVLDKKKSIPSIAEGIICAYKGDFKDAIKITDKLKEYYNTDPIPVFDILKYVLFLFDGNIQESLSMLKIIERKTDRIDKELDMNSIRHIRDTEMKNLSGSDYDEFEMDSIYNSTSKYVSKNANQNIIDALFLTSLIRNEKDFQMIKKHLNHAIKTNSDFAYYYNFNNLPKEKVIELKLTIEDNKNKIRLDSNDYQSYCKISNAFKTLGNSIASDYYQNKALSYNQLAIFYLSNGKFNEHKLDSLKKKYLEIDSLSTRKRLNDHRCQFYEKGRLLEKMEYYFLAQREFDKSLLIYPDNYNIINELGFVTFYQEKYQESVKYYSRLIELKPYYYLGYFNRACAYNRLNLNQKAKEDIDMSIKLFDEKKDTIAYPYYDDLIELKKTITTKLKSTPNTR